jgi:hypothetical protein
VYAVRLIVPAKRQEAKLPAPSPLADEYAGRGRVPLFSAELVVQQFGASESAYVSLLAWAWAY